MQLGENFDGIRGPMVAALAPGASDFVMPDLMRIGGVTGWCARPRSPRRAGSRCRATSTPRSPRTSWRQRPPRTGSSAVDWAAPLLAEPLPVTAGAIAASERPGAGLSWDEDAVAHFRID